jgi:hypothetical protein
VTKMTIDQFIDQVSRECAELEVEFRVCHDPCLDADSNQPCSGFFDSDEQVLAIAVGKPVSEWFPVLVHEYCHMRQWAEESPYWETQLDGTDTGNLISLWLAGHIELTPAQLPAVFGPTQAVEWDCERRAIELIKELELPIDVGFYARRANAYVLFYSIVAKTRSWYTPGKEPYTIAWSDMPDYLLPLGSYPVLESKLDLALCNSADFNSLAG